MQFHRTFRDGKSESYASTGAVASRADPVKRLENMGQFSFRDTEAMIANHELCGIQLPVQFHVYRSAHRGITHRIADYVFDSAAQQLG